MDSTRLPGKVLLPLNDHGDCSLDFISKAIGKSSLRNKAILATTSRPVDEPIAQHAKTLGLRVFRGNTLDLVKRHYEAAKCNDLAWQIRLTADCPFVTAKLIDGCIDQFRISPSKNTDLFSTKTIFPSGLDLEFIRTNALIKNHPIMSISEREHLTKFFYLHRPNRIKYFKNFDPGNVLSQTYLLDTHNDLLLIKRALAK